MGQHSGSVRGNSLKYSGFISYNHHDRREAIRIHRALERYRVPKRLQGRESPLGLLGKRLPPFFRDRDELASSNDLAAAVREGLEQSSFLIVVCSPNSAKSRWVNEEIRSFVAMGRRDRVRLIIIGGEPMSDDPALNCIPPAILEDAPGEPLAADARPGQDGREGARLKVLAALLGVPFDELRQREAQRRQRRLMAIATASTLGFAVTAGLAVAAVIARRQAEDALTIAQARTVTAERTLNFVKGMFRVSDPSIAQGEGDKITAREVVDRGARMLETGLEKEPAARADLGVTLAEVYNALGLYQRGHHIIRSTLALKHGQAEVTVRQLTTLGETQAQLGQDALSLENYRRAQTLLDTRGVTPAMRSRLLVDIGEARSAAGDLSGARAVLGQALAIDRGLGTEGQADVARDLEALGAVAFYGDKFSEARQLINSALRLRTAIEGENSPSVTDNRNLLAHIAYTEGDIAGAEALYRGNLARDQRVLGLKHPDTGVTMNNIARMLVDQRRFAEAAPLLERAIAVVEGQRGPKAADLVFMRWNLGLVRRYTGHATQADALFGQAVDLARAAGHPMLGPVLVDRADLACQTGHARQGLMMADEAVRIVAADYPDVPWRIAWAQTVRGTCLIRNARMAEGRTTIVAAQPVLVRRWPAGTLLGQAARTALAEAQNH